jgi:hypothetical protein
MPRLVTKITAEILPFYYGNITLFQSINGEIQLEDYINLNGFKAYIQDFTADEKVENLSKPPLFGLKNQYNLETVTLNISY